MMICLIALNIFTVKGLRVSSGSKYVYKDRMQI